MFCRKCGADIPEGMEVCPSCEMKWHKFLVYFLLWAGAIINFINGIKTVLGAQYGGLSERVYAEFPRLETVDIICGLCIIATASLTAVTAVRLRAFKSGAPKLLTAAYAATTLCPLLYAALVSLVIRGAAEDVSISMFGASVIISIIESVIMIFVNYIYYKKREPLFVN